MAVELVHLGSLYHDDVIDEAETRRGVPSVNARWSNIVAILAGDYLLARASALAASLGAPVAALLAETIGELCRGQVLELQHLFDVDRTEEIYFSAIGGKTAALFATACRIGGMVAEVDGPTLDALTEFGHHLGVCFQIVDDVLDVTGSDASLGKPAGNDLIEGVYTLPVILALDRDARRCATCSAASSTTTRSTRRVGSPPSDGAVDAALGAARDQAATRRQGARGDRGPRPRGHRRHAPPRRGPRRPRQLEPARVLGTFKHLWRAVSVPRTSRSRGLGGWVSSMAASRPSTSARKRSTASLNAFGASTIRPCAAPPSTSRRACGISSASSSASPTGVSESCEPVITSVGTRIVARARGAARRSRRGSRRPGR